jgi:hypothetical protein
MSETAAKLGRIIIPTEKIPRPGGPSGRESQKVERHEQEWHGVAILYARRLDDSVELRLFYEEHILQHTKDEIATRFGVGAIEWEIKTE